MSKLIIGRGVSLKPGLWTKALSGSGRLMFASEPAAFRLFGRRVSASLKRAGFSVTIHLLPRGEKAKDWKAVQGLLEAMLKAGLGRDSALVALGGGAVTDAAGFAAAIYLRGIPWVSIPTTLLGQLDSGIGGKTGINLPQGKNLAGAFHLPAAVVCDTDFLKTLPRRERISGLGEALKYGLVFEPGLWSFIRSNWDRLLDGDRTALETVIRKGASCKSRIVARDERETKGPRELLNFGHTFGHALETAAGHGTLRHGEAVVWGMRAALWLSAACAGFPAMEAARAEAFLATIPIPLKKAPSPERILKAAMTDKKARKGRPRFVLLERLGKPVVKDGIPDSLILEAIRATL